jgi:hypothetical protein
VTSQWNRGADESYAVKLEGPWEASDAGELKRVLDEIPKDQGRVVLDCRELNGFSAAWVQLVLAYTRYCRSIPRPVTVLVAEGHRGFLRAWGLDRSGWEGFFRVG